MRWQPSLSFFALICLFTPGVFGGNNGLALTPPLSWRSWNAFGWRISEATMEVAAAGLVDGSRPIVGRPAGTSLAALGFASVGMDEGWAQCAPKPGFPSGDWLFHRSNADGSISPVVNTSLFPDMRGLVSRIHALNLSVGWYLNPCFSYCWAQGETHCGDQCNAGDVQAFLSYGFQSVKLDGCGDQHNTSLFASLLNASGTPVLIENCHDEQAPKAPIAQGGCPDYHTYRTSTDIRNTYGSWLLNAYSVEPYASSGRSGPTCWGYPDMLMIGVGSTCAGDTCAAGGSAPLPSLTEQVSHYGLWCILSSPLTLSMDFSNASLVDAVWPTVSNVHALAVNQQWAGRPGGQLARAPGTDNVTLQHCTPGWAGDLPCSVPRTQGWWKPLQAAAGAVLYLNNDPEQQQQVTVDLAGLGAAIGLPCAPTCGVLDVWAQAELGTRTGSYTVMLQPHQSLFHVLHVPGVPWEGGEAAQ